MEWKEDLRVVLPKTHTLLEKMSREGKCRENWIPKRQLRQVSPFTAPKEGLIKETQVLEGRKKEKRFQKLSKKRAKWGESYPNLKSIWCLGWQIRGVAMD